MNTVPGFTAALYQGYFDLADALPRAPHHVKGVEFGIRALLESSAYPRMQAALNPSFRPLLCAATSQYEHAVNEPGDLAPSLRSERWNQMCDWISHFVDLSVEAQVKLGWLVGKLCFQETVLKMIPCQDNDSISKSAGAASLAYLRALARCRLWLDGSPTYQDYSMEEFRRIADHAPPGIASIDAHYQMVAQNVKHANNIDAVEHWQARHLNAIERAQPALDCMTEKIVMSRYHRVGGFLPQMLRDRDGVVREMALAEDFALMVPRKTQVDAACADEILYPVLESRTKEAIWIGDLDLADERTTRLLALSPADPRAWLHRAQVLIERDDAAGALAAYRNSARFAPPGGEIAWFMAGQCLEMLGDSEQAVDAYLSSLEIDPLGISALQRLAPLAASLGNMPLRTWCEQRLADLERARHDVVLARKPEPYKNLPPPV